MPVGYDRRAIVDCAATPREPGGLYSPLRLSPETSRGRILIALELPDCGCPELELPADPVLAIEVAEDRILALAFRGMIDRDGGVSQRCLAHACACCDEGCPRLERARDLQGMESRALRDLFRKLLASARAYDPDGYDPPLVWAGPVWMVAGERRIDVSRPVSGVTTSEGWTAVYAARAQARLPLYHPRDDNPRNRDVSKVALQATLGKHQGRVIAEDDERPANPVRKGEEPGWLDRVILKWRRP